MKSLSVFTILFGIWNVEIFDRVATQKNMEKKYGIKNWIVPLNHVNRRYELSRENNAIQFCVKKIEQLFDEINVCCFVHLFVRIRLILIVFRVRCWIFDIKCWFSWFSENRFLEKFQNQMQPLKRAIKLHHINHANHVPPIKLQLHYIFSNTHKSMEHSKMMENTM